MKLKTTLLALFVVLCFASCNPTKQAIKKAPPLLPGFTLIPAPNSLDKPGTIIAVSKDGISQPLGTLDLNVTQGSTVMGKITGKRSSTVSALLSFIGFEKVSATADASTKLTKNLTYNMNLDGTTIERLDLLKLKTELENTRKMISDFSASNNMSDYKFYIITEAVKANKLTYNFDIKSANDAGLKTEINKVVTLTPNVKWENESNYSLAYDLPSPLYVYSKYWTLNVVTQATGDTKFVMKDPINDNDPIYIAKP